MSKSPTITEDVEWSGDEAEWLRNPHAGECLDLDFLRPIGMDSTELGYHLGIAAERIDAVVSGRVAIDADLDLRLGRYFAMSPGFFLRLQTNYELIEARRRNGAEFDRIVPRTA